MLKKTFIILRVTSGFVLLVALLVTLTPVQIVLLSIDTRRIYVLTKLFWRICCWIFGLKVKIRGAIVRKPPVLYVSNHLSYLDSAVLGRYLDASFIANDDIAAWPGMGLLAKLQYPLFIKRNPRLVKLHLQQVAERLDNGGSLILFPEGTSGNGSGVMPFKSSLFSLLEGASKDVPVQPITILIRGENGEPISKESRERYSWFDDTPFLDHFLRALLSTKTNVEVVFHRPVELAGFTSRKDLAGYTHQVISKPLVALE